MILVISAFQSCELECFVCLLAYIVWSVTIYYLLVTIACCHHTFLFSKMVIRLLFNVVTKRTMLDLFVFKI